MTSLEIKNELERIWREKPLKFPLHYNCWSVKKFFKSIYNVKVGLFYIKKGKMGKVR